MEQEAFQDPPEFSPCRDGEAGPSRTHPPHFPRDEISFPFSSSFAISASLCKGWAGGNILLAGTFKKILEGNCPSYARGGDDSLQRGWTCAGLHGTIQTSIPRKPFCSWVRISLCSASAVGTPGFQDKLQSSAKENCKCSCWDLRAAEKGAQGPHQMSSLDFCLSVSHC